MNITKHIPNTITSCNLVCGCIATAFAFAYDYETAFLFIILGAVFDFFDGMSARLLGVSSPIGLELDSLADDVTFGVAPSAMVFSLFTTLPWPQAVAGAAAVIPFLAFIMAAFSALRLAKFNLDTRQTTSFIGLPTPANALFWASLIVGAGDSLAASPYLSVGLLALMFVCCWLLVSELPMFALKFKTWGWRGNEVKWTFLITCIPLIAIFRAAAFAVIIAWYVALSAITSAKAKAS